MSRLSLKADAQRVGVPLSYSVRERRYQYRPAELRAAIWARVYGAGVELPPGRKADELDRIITGAVDQVRGLHGYMRMVAVASFREGNDLTFELKRLQALKRRRPVDEARIAKAAAGCFAKAVAYRDGTEVVK